MLQIENKKEIDKELSPLLYKYSARAKKSSIAPLTIGIPTGPITKHPTILERWSIWPSLSSLFVSAKALSYHLLFHRLASSKIPSQHCKRLFSLTCICPTTTKLARGRSSFTAVPELVVLAVLSPFAKV